MDLYGLGLLLGLAYHSYTDVRFLCSTIAPIAA